eukprot:2808875-Rhodomonas_salina.1
MERREALRAVAIAREEVKSLATVRNLPGLYCAIWGCCENFGSRADVFKGVFDADSEKEWNRMRGRDRWCARKSDEGV